MPTACTIAPPAATGPDQTAPRGWKWRVLYRRRRTDPWRVIVETATGQEAWDCMCSGRASGEYRPQLVRVGLFDGSDRAVG